MQALSLKSLEDFHRYGDGGAPAEPDRYGLWRFFREVKDLGEGGSWFSHAKVGNLSGVELGLLLHSVRRYLDLANYADVEGLGEVSDYLRLKSALISASSLSKRGFLVQMAVTQKRVSKHVGSRKVMTKTGLLGRTEVVEGGDDEDDGGGGGVS